MNQDVLRDKIREYCPANVSERGKVLHELIQHFVLASLAKSDFFAGAAFHGGSCLRILYQLERFSEDLDFLLKKPNKAFVWRPYLEHIKKEGISEGIEFDIVDQSTTDTAVKKAFLNADCLPNGLALEIDTNPPVGSTYEVRSMTFPMTVPLTIQTLESSFALKAYVLLYQDGATGRDWYDLLWFLARRVVPNYLLLESAVEQQGLGMRKRIVLNTRELLAELRRSVKNVNWTTARKDIRSSVTNREQASIQSWSTDFFLSHIDRLGAYLR